MKKGIYTLLTCLVISLFAGCEDKTSWDNSKVTHFLELAIKGDAVVKVPVGTTYTEAGAVAIENGEDVSDKIEIKGSVDVNKIGVYNLTYSAKNEDGFATSASRMVIVCNPNSAIPAGVFKTADGTFRISTAGARTNYPGYKVTVLEISPNVYSVSDLLGGYYDQRAGYGSDYAIPATVKLNADNTIELVQSEGCAGWQDDISALTNAKFDPATGEMTWVTTYAAMPFTVVLITK